MRFASIRELDVSNGENVGISLFVQGCSFHCDDCFNVETWDFDGGKEWTQEVEDRFIRLADKPYIKRISILGGEPLAEQNIDGVLNLVNKIQLSLPDKIIWLYTGFTWEQIMSPVITVDCDPKRDETFQKRKTIVSKCDVLVDGRYVHSERNQSLKWRGSKNQRVINIKESINEKVLACKCE